MSTIGLPDNASLGSSFGNGMLMGGTTLAGLYGLWELKKYLLKKFYSKPEVFPDDYLAEFNAPILKDDRTSTKTAELDMSKYFMYGMGIPTGAYLAYNTIDYIRDKEEEFKLKSKVRELEKAIKGSHEMDAVLAAEQKQKSAIELAKMSNDRTIDSFLDAALFGDSTNTDGSITKQAGDLGWLVNALTIDAVQKYLPALYGSLVPLGALSGYYGTQYFVDPGAGKPKDIMEPPQLAYRLAEQKKKNKAVNNALEVRDRGVTVTASLKRKIMMEKSANWFGDAASGVGNWMQKHPATLTGTAGFYANPVVGIATTLGGLGIDYGVSTLNKAVKDIQDIPQKALLNAGPALFGGATLASMLGQGLMSGGAAKRQPQQQSAANSLSNEISNTWQNFKTPHGK